jgi:hypothetical protein
MSIAKEILELADLGQTSQSHIRHVIGGGYDVEVSDASDAATELARLKVISDQCLVITKVDIESYPTIAGVKRYDLHSAYHYWENARLYWTGGDKENLRVDTPYQLVTGECLFVFSGMTFVSLNLIAHRSVEDAAANIVTTAKVKARVSGFRMPADSVKLLARSATLIDFTPT